LDVVIRKRAGAGHENLHSTTQMKNEVESDSFWML